MLRKLWSIGPRGWLLLLRAQVELLAARRLVRRVPQGELVASIAAKSADVAVTYSDMERAEMMGAAIDRAARFGIGRPLCLVRSIALHRLLEQHGIRGSQVRVGVRIGRRGFEAHAWVELKGRIIGDNPEYVRHFDVLQDLTMSARSIHTAGLAS